ncbi:MAG: hypothetical protein ACE5QV_04660 [Fidelibacterota bacterium]
MNRADLRWVLPVVLMVVLMLFALISCNNMEPEQPEPTFLTVKSLDINFNEVTREFFLAAKVAEPKGRDNIDFVWYFGFRPDSSEPQVEGMMYDDGTHRDIIGYDSVFSVSIDSSFAGQLAGRFSFQVVAVNADGDSSDFISKSYDVYPNLPPEIQLVEGPDSTARGDTIFIAVSVTDPQGPDDIRRVKYDVMDPDSVIIRDPTFVMRDDGLFGDAYPDDGVYSVKQPTDPGGRIGKFTFLIWAEDRAGNVSEVLPHPVIIF